MVREVEHGKFKVKAGVAQLVEHDLAKVGVASSSLVSRSRIVNRCVLMVIRYQSVVKSTLFYLEAINE